MKENKRVLDEELSKGKYVTYSDVADLLINDTSDVVAIEKIEGQLKAYVSRDLKHKGVLDYKNGKNEKYGVKYRQGYEHYLRYIEEKKEFEKMPRAEKRKYATIGLDLLLDQGNTEILDEIEREAIETYVPIIRKEMQSFLRLLLTMQKPMRILEVGTAVGFSAILMAEYGPKDCQIVTIENYDKRIPIAKNNFIRAGKE